MAFISSLPLISSFQSRSNNTLLANNRCSPCIPSQNPHHQQQHQAPSRLHPWRMCDASTSKKDRFNITLLPGDGIGPEIMDATVCVLEAISKKYSIEFNFETALIGGAAIDEYKYPFPEATLKQCQASDSILLACIGGPKWDDYPRELRPETGLLTLRRDLDLFANLRPAKVIPQLIDSSTLKKEVIDGVDIMVIRELTSDVYFGTPKGLQVRDDGSGKRVGYNNMIYQEEEIERIGHVAYKIASKRNGTLFSIDKANVLDVSQLWRNVMTELNDQYKHISLSHMYVDNAAMQLIRYPKQFDTIVTGNIFGDILSDAASMLVGSLGMLPSASLGGSSNSPGVFEPVHGSAPDIAGENKANPAACILSAAMMMKYDLNRPDISLALEQAVNDVLDDGLRTGDIMSEGMTLVGCKEFGEAVVQKVLVAAEAPAAAV